ncbi:hypothetical protein BFX80_10455 [Cobetia marina]|nr:hypothetical protein BFX80_10455 [Cobetia marina]
MSVFNDTIQQSGFFRSHALSGDGNLVSWRNLPIEKVMKDRVEHGLGEPMWCMTRYRFPDRYSGTEEAMGEAMEERAKCARQAWRYRDRSPREMVQGSRVLGRSDINFGARRRNMHEITTKIVKIETSCGLLGMSIRLCNTVS